jgi:hypothetical protein
LTQPIFDGGIFSILIIIGFVCVAFYKKIGALMLVVPIVAFLITGLVIVTGEDVAFYKVTNPVNMTITTTNGTVTTTTTYHKITPSNETDYLVGNGQFPITGTGELILGYSLILLSLILGVLFVDWTVKGRLVLQD